MQFASLHAIESLMYMHVYRGVDTFFKTLAKLASSFVFSLAKSENNWLKI
jgi:hypothetical protein